MRSLPGTWSLATKGAPGVGRSWVEVAGGMLAALAVSQAGPRMCAMCFNFQNCGSWALVA